MQIFQLQIKNFRGIKEGKVDFNGHSLLIGGNNVGKSTVCEALDLVLGPERLSRAFSIDEHDFYKSTYLDDEGNPIHIVIRVVLGKLSEDLESKYSYNLAWWDPQTRTVFDQNNEAGETEKDSVEPVIVVEMRGFYDKNEDEFKADTFIVFPPQTDENTEPKKFSRSDKRNAGFLFLRTIRTGSRALSMEKGSLLDVILRMKEDDKTEMWEQTLGSLKSIDPKIHDLPQLNGILQEVESRVNNFIKLGNTDEKLGFYVSNLTREKLRKAITFFATTEYGDNLVPFYQLGTGAINALVFSMLTFIAELKGNVIFAMEEPEIALPPHTQRRIAKYVMNDMDQSIFTSHSPYIIEQFASENVIILSRTDDGKLTSTFLRLQDFIKAKTYKGNIKQTYAEAILSKGVILVEGKTEEDLFPAVCDVMEKSDPNFVSLDIAGISIVNVGSDAGQILKHAKLFHSLGIDVYAFYDKPDKNKAKAADTEKIEELCEKSVVIDYHGIEKFLTEETSADILKQFLLNNLDKVSNDKKVGLPDEEDEKIIREIATNILKKGKGDGLAANLIHLCKEEEIPLKLREFVREITQNQAFNNQSIYSLV